MYGRETRHITWIVSSKAWAMKMGGGGMGLLLNVVQDVAQGTWSWVEVEFGSVNIGLSSLK